MKYLKLFENWTPPSKKFNRSNARKVGGQKNIFIENIESWYNSLSEDDKSLINDEYNELIKNTFQNEFDLIDKIMSLKPRFEGGIYWHKSKLLDKLIDFVK